ncbi:hypothetical protein J3A83DRAFT_4201889 [Scleroderma citrinum]
MFMRNRGRTDQQWMQLQQLTRNKSTALVTDGASDDDDESQEGSSPPPRRFVKKKKQTRNDVPRWQAIGVDKLVSSDEDDDSDVVVVENNDSSRKRKRERSRSRSITPPPTLSEYQLASTKYLVRQALAVPQRAPSPTFLADESTDTIVLDPELAKIAEAVKKQVQHNIENEQAGGPQVVEVKVKWIPHPLNHSAQKHLWAFKMKRRDTFQELFEELADLASVMVSQLVVTYDGKRVFSSGTPSSLRIWAEGELEAYDKHTYEYIRTRRHQRPESPASPAGEDDNDGASTEASDAEMHSNAESETESTGGDTFKLVLRSAVTKDITLTVRPTTMCDAIVKAFLKAAGLPDVYSENGNGKKSKPYPQLKIDGEKQASNAEIGDAELDDGDLVEVVGI